MIRGKENVMEWVRSTPGIKQVQVRTAPGADAFQFQSDEGENKKAIEDRLSRTLDFLEPGKYYHILLVVDGGKQTFSVNGIKRTIPFSGTMRPTPLEWQIGSAYDPMTISLIRFGGE